MVGANFKGDDEASTEFLKILKDVSHWKSLRKEVRGEFRKEWKTLRNEVADIRSVADAVELLHDFTQRQPEFTYLLKCCLLGVFLSQINFFAFVSVRGPSYLFLLPIATLGFVVFSLIYVVVESHPHHGRQAFYRKYLTVKSFQSAGVERAGKCCVGAVFSFHRLLCG